MRYCSVLGCPNQPAYRGGLCEMHHPLRDRRDGLLPAIRVAPADIPYCGESCPGLDLCTDPTHGGAMPQGEAS